MQDFVHQQYEGPLEIYSSIKGYILGALGRAIELVLRASGCKIVFRCVALGFRISILFRGEH